MASKPKPIPTFIIGDQKTPWKGINTITKDTRDLDPGNSYDEVNWLTGRYQDHIELRLGSVLLGTTRRNIANTHVSGLGVGIGNNGNEVPFYSYNRKVLFYNSDTNDTQEVNTTDILPPAASGEDTNFVSYQNLAGAFVYLTSPNSGIYKIAVANPEYVSDQDVQDYHFGFIQINYSRMRGMNRQGKSSNSKDTTGYYLSHVDKQNVSDYTINYMSIPTPTLTPAISGGLLEDGIYYVAITAFGPAGSETLIGTIVSALVSGGGDGSIGITFPNSAGATQYNVYGTQTIQITLDSVTGIFGDSHTITAPSGASGVIEDVSGSPTLIVDTLDVATFQLGDIVTDGTSGATGTILGIDIFFKYPSISPNAAQINESPIFPVIGTINSLTFMQFYTGNPPSASTQQTVAQIATGDGTTKTFSGTLPDLSNPYTAFYVSITDGTELFLDNKSGELVGSLGGTGTINYITGAYSVTFNTAPTNGVPITASWYEEDATNGGVADFVIDPSDTTNASAQIFRQDDSGGNAQAAFPYQGVDYCFHVLRSWLLTQSQGTDSSGNPATNFNNQPYYEQIGLPHPRAIFPTGDGILFLNNATPSQPKFSIMQIPPGSTNLTVVPVELSQDLDLSAFNYDLCVIFRFGDLDILSCQNIVNGQIQSYNSVTFARNIVSGLWNKLNFSISCAALFNGTLLSGSSLSPNLFTLFSGYSDDGVRIPNYRKSGYLDFGIQGLKKVNYLNLQGLIQPSQNLNIYLSLDNGEYILVFTVKGTGPYVSTDVVAVGTETVGTGTVGGGLEDEIIYANKYEVDIPIHTDLFEYISFMVSATDFGYVSVNRAEYKDIRYKRMRLKSYEDPEIDNG